MQGFGIGLRQGRSRGGGGGGSLNGLAFWRPAGTPLYLESQEDVLAGVELSNSPVSPGLSGGVSYFWSEDRFYFGGSGNNTIWSWAKDGTRMPDITLGGTLLSSTTFARRASDGRIFYDKSSSSAGLLFYADPPDYTEVQVNTTNFTGHVGGMIYVDVLDTLYLFQQGTEILFEVTGDLSEATALYDYSASYAATYTPYRYDASKHVLVSPYNRQVWIFDLATGAVTNYDPGSPNHVQPLGELNKILFTTNAGIYLCDWADGANVQLLSTPPDWYMQIVRFPFS